ncbi:MAG: NADP-dependent oxidoreductase [Myxococcota bacterium]
MKSKVWILKKRPQGEIVDGDLVLEDRDLPALEAGQVRVQTVYLSLDPANRTWMNKGGSYRSAIELDGPMEGAALGVVAESQAESMPAGTLVTGLLDWAEFSTKPAKALTALPTIPGVPMPAFLGPLGITGLTAYFGLLDIGKPKAGETVVVSAAAGAVGSIVGQIAKIHGCRAVGIAGTDEKCKWLLDVAGFDAAINYKTEDVGSKLDEHCPDGIDINFENVGGPIMNQVMARLNNHARMPLCGLISGYNETKPQPGPVYFPMLLVRRVSLQGFIVTDYGKRFPEGVQALAGWLGQGKLKFETDIVDGLENSVSALSKLFSGQNFGKLMVRVSPEP